MRCVRAARYAGSASCSTARSVNQGISTRWPNAGCISRLHGRWPHAQPGSTTPASRCGAEATVQSFLGARAGMMRHGRPSDPRGFGYAKEYHVERCSDRSRDYSPRTDHRATHPELHRREGSRLAEELLIRGVGQSCREISSRIVPTCPVDAQHARIRKQPANLVLALKP